MLRIGNFVANILNLQNAAHMYDRNIEENGCAYQLNIIKKLPVSLCNWAAISKNIYLVHRGIMHCSIILIFLVG